MNTRRSQRSADTAGDLTEPGSTVIPSTQPAQFQAAQRVDAFGDLSSRLEAGNCELKDERRQTLERRAQELREEQARLKGLSTQRAEGETDDPAQSEETP
ncbi:MAG: hypothetical protein M1816_004810 [Peltula sp. TS41687]|nr:MAG: hypothetical protein M1816_004810 [Peltula sp. TS41687]